MEGRGGAETPGRFCVAARPAELRGLRIRAASDIAFHFVAPMRVLIVEDERRHARLLERNARTSRFGWSMRLRSCGCTQRLAIL